MKRKLIRIFIVVISVLAIFGGELNARGHQHLVQKGDTLWGFLGNTKYLSNRLSRLTVFSQRNGYRSEKTLIPGAPVRGFGIGLKLGIHCLVLRVAITLTGKTFSEL